MATKAQQETDDEQPNLFLNSIKLCNDRTALFISHCNSDL